MFANGRTALLWEKARRSLSTGAQTLKVCQSGVCCTCRHAPYTQRWPPGQRNPWELPLARKVLHRFGPDETSTRGILYVTGGLPQREHKDCNTWMNTARGSVLRKEASRNFCFIQGPDLKSRSLTYTVEQVSDKVLTTTSSYRCI
jgi:hypothetical protein